MNYDQLIELFQQNSNQKYDDFNSKIVNSGVRTIGCTVPFVRSVAKKHLQSLNEAVALPTHDYFEVDLLKGIVVSSANIPFEQKEKYLTDFANTLENWAVCDCSTVKVPQSEQEQYFLYFCSLCLSQSPFVCRYGVVNLLANFLDNEHVDGVFEAIEKISVFGSYYVDMAVAWLLATSMVHCRNETVAFMEGKGLEVLNVFTYNKALQKMRDSFRVSAEDKAWSRAMKR